MYFRHKHSPLPPLTHFIMIPVSLKKCSTFFLFCSFCQGRERVAPILLNDTWVCGYKGVVTAAVWRWGGEGVIIFSEYNTRAQGARTIVSFRHSHFLRRQSKDIMSASLAAFTSFSLLFNFMHWINWNSTIFHSFLQFQHLHVHTDRCVYTLTLRP